MDGIVGDWIGFHGKIALEDISCIEKESIDHLRTSLFVIGIVSVVAVLFALSGNFVGDMGFRMPME